jgi:hypothetical protein
MTSITVTLFKIITIPKAGDYDEYQFRFSAIQTDLIGGPEEAARTRRILVTARMSRSLQAIWRLEGAAVPKVLFECARRQLEERASVRGDLGDFEVDLNSYAAPRQCPYEPDRILMREGIAFQVLLNKPLGFHGT